MAIVLFSSIILGLTLYLWLTGFRKSSIEPENSNLGNKYIDLVTIYRDNDNNTEVAYDKNTKVMYFFEQCGYHFGITPIYNSDGTVKLYDEENSL